MSVTVSSTTTVQKRTAIDANGNVFEVPDFTIKDVLSAIPKKCFERSLTKSLLYVARDIAAMASVGYVANQVLYPGLVENCHVSIRFAYWLTYTVIQGFIGTGLWVLAHECGHQAFSDYGSINDLVGWVLHSYWLVPYFSWKYSHGKHHKNIGHMERDMVFVPLTKERFKKKRGILGDISKHAEDTPIMTLMELLGQQIFGWFAYLFTDATGQKYPNHSKFTINHFYPFAPLFEKKDALYILLSDLGLVTQLLVLKSWYEQYGLWSVFINWFVVYMWVNHWLVFITYLQHTDGRLAHFGNDEWDFAKGAAATIDREFPIVGPYFFHDIIETHVLHHYCSRIPFYNAREATEAIKKVMHKHYKHTDENMFVSLWKSFRTCQYVVSDDGGNVYMYRNINNIGVGTGKVKKA